MTKKLYIIVLGALILALPSCSYTKLVPEGRSLLWKNTIYVNEKKGAPDEAENILKQQPNSRFFKINFLAPNLALYNWGNGNDTNIFSRLGEAPVLIDSAKVATGANQLQNWYFNKGYFNASSSYRIDSLAPKKTAAIYYVRTRDRYRIKDISLEGKNKTLTSVSAQVLGKDSIIRSGIYYDADLLERLRTDISQAARDIGYYNFSKSYIRFEADTFLQGDFVNIKLLIDQAVVETEDTTYTQDHQQYFIKNIYIRPDFQYGNEDNPDDTLVYHNYVYTYDTLQYRPRYITDAIHFKKGERYSEKKVKETYSHLVGYKAFQLSDISFTKDGTIDSLGVPGLTVKVNLDPLPKRTFSIEPEVTHSAGGYFGVSGSIGWTNRNFLGGGEALQIRLNSGIQAQANPGSEEKSQAFEVGGEVGIEFPRFLLPFNTVGLLPKRMQPKSRVSLSYNKLVRREFHRNTFGTRLSYSWKESERKAHKVDLIDITYSEISNVSDGFRSQLSDIQRQAFTSEFISATRYTYTLNENLITRRKNPRFFKGVLEVAGNTLSLLDNTTGLGSTKESNDTRTLFDVQYFQYFKTEVDGRYYWNFRKKQSWVNRLYCGYILPYGNSKIETDTGTARIPPFSKYLYMGGSNDMRAWTAYRLGAGTQFNTDYSKGVDTTFATGTFKLLFQSEYRFPIVSYLQGAIFMDVGNIWLTGGLENEQTDLKLGDLYNQLAVGSGIGLRLDFDFFVIRFDIGMKVRDPALLKTNQEWVIFSQPAFAKNWTYNFALGYPF